jgi:hypothetical protein
MDRIFLVVIGDYDDYGVVASFSTIENAQQFIDEYEWEKWDEPRIEETPLDKWQRRRSDRHWKIEFYDATEDVMGRPCNSETVVRELFPDFTVPDEIPLGVSRMPWGWEVILTAPDRESAIVRAKAQRESSFSN